MTESSRELLQQLLSNEITVAEKGWAFVYVNYYPMVSDMVRKKNGSENDAVDIFHDGLLIFNRNLKNGSFRGESTIKTYLYSICRNLWLKQFDRKQRQLEAEAESIVVSQQDIDYLVNVDVVSSLMNELNEGCRNILVEYYFNDRSMVELKDMFNVNSVQAAKNKKWRCLNCLERMLKEKGVIPAPS